jgi:hypothetical protein
MNINSVLNNQNSVIGHLKEVKEYEYKFKINLHYFFSKKVLFIVIICMCIVAIVGIVVAVLSFMLKKEPVEEKGMVLL